MWSAFATLIRIRCGGRSGILSPRHLRKAPIQCVRLPQRLWIAAGSENYFVPTDANIARDANVSSEALRVSDYTKPLAALGIKASIVILDAARANAFAQIRSPLAGGLALVEPEPETLIAFKRCARNGGANEAGPYSSYAQALAEMMREGGLPVTDLFNRVRLRSTKITKGAQVPWNASKLQRRFTFLNGRRMRLRPRFPPEQTSSIRSKPIRDLDARDAYLAALDRDNLQDYENFLVAYPDDPMARRVRAIDDSNLGGGSRAAVKYARRAAHRGMGAAG